MKKLLATGIILGFIASNAFANNVAVKYMQNTPNKDGTKFATFINKKDKIVDMVFKSQVSATNFSNTEGMKKYLQKIVCKDKAFRNYIDKGYVFQIIYIYKNPVAVTVTIDKCGVN